MTTAPARALDAPSAEVHACPPRSGGVLRSLSQMMGSLALVSAVGLICLPFLARNLGAQGYGHFSLFLTGLGLLSSLDIARPTLVRELSGSLPDAQRGKLLSLPSASQLWLTPLSLAVGSWLFGSTAGVALAIGVFFFVAASAPYALLAADDRVGIAATVRNSAWAAAFVVATGLSFFELPAHAFLWPFSVANVVIYVINRRLAGSTQVKLFARPDFGLLSVFRERSLDILGLSVAAAVVVSADKLMLEHSASAEVFGSYTAQYDLAAKINLFSTALGTVLFPALSSHFATQGFESAARRLVRQLSWIALSYFVVIALLLCFSEEIIGLMLGAEFTAGARIYPLMLVGVFLALFGHTLTPWQRACGDFRTQRRSYAISAILMVAVGAYAIPRYGALGAIATYLTARSADLLLIFAEVARIPREILAPWRIVALGSMLAVLISLAAAQLMWAGGAA